MFDFSIVIVTFNNQYEIVSCIESLGHALAGFRAEIFLIDNYSADETFHISKKLLSQFDERHHWSLICNETNIGFTKAVNQGLRQAQGDFVLLLNPDTELPADVFRPLVEILHADPQVGMVAPQLRNPDGSIQPSCRRFPRRRDVIYHALGLHWLFKRSREFNSWKMGDFDHQSQREVDQPQGAFLLARRQAVDQVGLLDERFPMFFSDVDWCRRFIAHGWKILFVPSVQIVHHKGTSIYRNRLKMIWSSHRSFYHYFQKYQRGFFQRMLNLLIGEILIGLALVRSIFYLLSSNELKDLMWSQK
ncbi:MAG: glycosyltransferase family 2 protein [candidate division KSB1 bacterium]|nr:glycosyltransferase family 2 protein [candidate division KSB1 bacterium]